MSGNPLVRFDEGRVGRTARCRPLSYSTVFARDEFGLGPPVLPIAEESASRQSDFTEISRKDAKAQIKPI
jgi:hypothetical protein